MLPVIRREDVEQPGALVLLASSFNPHSHSRSLA
jgi:hypothetical protein